VNVNAISQQSIIDW